MSTQQLATPAFTGQADRVQRHIITPEYPPQPGGVSDYVVQLADGLAREGDEVHVWCPAIAATGPSPGPAHVHHDLGRLTRSDLKTVGEKLDRFPAPRRILLQWVPHGFGYRSMNVGFCVWLWNRARRGDRLEIMVHEPFLMFEGSWRQRAAALVHRLMTVILLRAAERVWVSIPRYGDLWRPYALGRRVPFQWLPLPSNVPEVRDARGIAARRSQYGGADGLLIGHFGTFGKAINAYLEKIIPRVLDRNPNARVVLIGPGTALLEQLVAQHPALGHKIYTTGIVAATDPALSCLISACDLLMQPYPDGVSSRRTSIMASLNHGKAVVTTSGAATEPIWFEAGAVSMTAAGDTEAYVRAVNELCADSAKRMALARAARSLFEERFDVRHAVAALRQPSQDRVCAS